MQAGTDLWEAAGYLGMTIEMLHGCYGHHHPDHLSGAKTALSRHRQRHIANTERFCPEGYLRCGCNNELAGGKEL